MQSFHDDLERAAMLAAVRAGDEANRLRTAERNDIRQHSMSKAHLADGYWQDRWAAEQRLRAAVALVMALRS